VNTALLQIGLSPEQVRRACAAQVKKGSCGRRGLPGWLVAQMHAAYLRLGSTWKVARLYGRSAQSIQELFAKRGLDRRPDSRQRRGATRTFGGLVFTRGNMGWRGTQGDRPLLHHLIWTKHFGPVPAGCQVSFRNGDFEDVRPENLFCATPAEVSRHHLQRRYPETAGLTAEQRITRRRQIGLARYYRLKKKFKAEGLRCDGKTLARSRQTVPPAVVAIAGRDLAKAWEEFRQAA